MSNPPNPSSIIRIYSESFLPIYADVATFLKVKPTNILIEMENAFMHFIQSTNVEIPQEQRDNNLEKARCHLLRATLDCHKCLWLALAQKIEPVASDAFLSQFVTTDPQKEFHKLWREFNEKANEARKIELRKVGVDPLASIGLWLETNNIGKKLVDMIDYQRLSYFRKFRLRLWIRKHLWEWIIAFILGVLAIKFCEIYWPK